jgi:hypothetical protein
MHARFGRACKVAVAPSCAYAYNAVAETSEMVCCKCYFAYLIGIADINVLQQRKSQKCSGQELRCHISG